MPGKRTSNDVVQLVYSNRQKGKSVKELCRMFSMTRKTVYNIIKRAENENRLSLNLPPVGRSRKISERIENVLRRKIKENPKASVRMLAHELKEEYDISISHESVRQILKKSQNASPTAEKEPLHTLQSTNSNDFDDEVSHPDKQSSPRPIIQDEVPYENYYYNDPDLKGSTPVLIHKSLSPFQSNDNVLDQTLNTLQNQMELQTKILEQLSQTSSTMTALMERQVNAAEKQTEALRRQAAATEHHTLVMNSFIDMLREKIQEKNHRSSLSSKHLLSDNK